MGNIFITAIQWEEETWKAEILGKKTYRKIECEQPIQSPESVGGAEGQVQAWDSRCGLFVTLLQASCINLKQCT